MLFQYLRNFFGEYIFQKQNPLFVKSTVCQKRFCPRCSYGTKAKWYTHNNTTPHVIERDGLAKQPKFSPSIQSSAMHTPPNFKVCARRKVPAKRFKNCHILYIRKPRVAFSVFHSLYFIFSLMNALIYVDIDQGIHQ